MNVVKIQWWQLVETIFVDGELFGAYRAIGQMSRVFTNGPGDRGSIPGRVIPKTQRMALDAALLSTLQYKVRIKDKVDQSWEWSRTHSYTSV